MTNKSKSKSISNKKNIFNIFKDKIDSAYKTKKNENNIKKKYTRKKNKHNKKTLKSKPSKSNNISLKKSLKIKPLYLTSKKELLNYIRLGKKYNNFKLFVIPRKNKNNLKDKIMKYVYKKFYLVPRFYYYANTFFSIHFWSINHKISKKEVNKVNGIKGNELSNNIIKLRNEYKLNGKTRFLIIDISLHPIVGNMWVGHSNLLIIDLKNNTAEYFEPYGGIFSISDDNYEKYCKKSNNCSKFDYKFRKLFLFIKDYFTECFKASNTKLILPCDYMPIETFQSYEHSLEFRLSDLGGYCVIWSHWYLSLRLKFPDTNGKKLIKQTEKLITKKTNFLRLIRNYCNFLNKELDKKKYSIKKIKINNLNII